MATFEKSRLKCTSSLTGGFHLAELSKLEQYLCIFSQLEGSQKRHIITFQVDMANKQPRSLQNEKYSLITLPIKCESAKFRGQTPTVVRSAVVMQGYTITVHGFSL